MSREAFSAQWSRRGAYVARMERGNYYSLQRACGFFVFDSRPDNKEVIRELRRKAEFLGRGRPGPGHVDQPEAPVRVTDLGSGYRNSVRAAPPSSCRWPQPAIR